MSSEPGTNLSGCTDFCSLPPQELHARAEEIRAALVPQILHHEQLPSGIAWHFPASPGVRDQLEDFVAFERRCCGDMTFAVEPSDVGLRLRIEGDGAEAFAALTAASAAPSRRVGARLLRAGGLGLGASLLVCCILPLGVSAVAGAAVAAPLATLDQPLYIATGGLLAGIVAWVVQGERTRVACDDGC